MDFGELRRATDELVGLVKLVITFEGLRLLINDLIASGQKPGAILVSPHEKRDLKRELMDRAKQRTPDTAENDHDLETIGFINGIPIISHKDVDRGKARIMLATDVLDRNRDVVVK